MKSERDFKLFIEALGSYLSHYKQATGKSQKAIGDDAGVSGATVSNIIRGKTRPTTLTLWRILNGTGNGDALTANMFKVRPRRVESTRRVA